MDVRTSEKEEGEVMKNRREKETAHSQIHKHSHRQRDINQSISTDRTPYVFPLLIRDDSRVSIHTPEQTEGKRNKNKSLAKKQQQKKTITQPESISSHRAFISAPSPSFPHHHPSLPQAPSRATSDHHRSSKQ